MQIAIGTAKNIGITMLSVRIVTSDHSMDDPIPGLDVTYSSFRGSVVKKVPVIRIFGPDSAGNALTHLLVYCKVAFNGLNYHGL